MAPPPPQSRFLEGSMNDRVSAAPPADFLGPGAENKTDYERQFAMDWKPPELTFGGPGGYSDVPGSRASLVSVSSGTGASPSGSGFFAHVKGRLGMHRSRSTADVGVDEDVGDSAAVTGRGGNAIVNGSSSSLGPPVPRHKRPDAMGTNTLRKKGGGPRQPDLGFPKKDADAAGVTKRATAAPPVSEPVGAAPPVPSFDPTRRPSRDEITANYQSLLASGFFGTHAIQSTRFSPPGRNLHSQEQPNMLSFAQRLVEEDEASQGHRSLPPSPQRKPPPPPPRREAPQPPALPVDTEPSSSATSRGLPFSSTVVFNPISPERSYSGDTGTGSGMPPPPLSPAKNPEPIHKPSLPFPSAPTGTTSTRPAAEPERPYRPPPVSIARFSRELGRPRSFDLALEHQRGVKRPFASTTNDSQSSFGTSRTSFDYDPMDADGGGGGDAAGAAATLGADKKRESGARKLVKRLRKSASKLSIDLGRSISRQTSSTSAKFVGDTDGSEYLGNLEPPSRTSTSSNLRRSFSWRLGSRPGIGTDLGGSSADHHHQHHHHHHHPSSSGSNLFAGSNGGDHCFSLNNNNNSSDHTAPPAPVPPAHGAAPPALAVVTDPPTSAERNRLKKRDIRGRRLRRKESVIKPSPSSKASPLNQAPMVSPAVDMDWQSNAAAAATKPSRNQSRSRSRPRRSDASILLHSQARPGTAQATGGDEVRPDVAGPAARPQPNSAGDGAAHGQGADANMEGVEFSFHFPGRVRPGGPLAVVPDANRGIPAVPSIPGVFNKNGSMRVVRSNLV